MIPYEMQNCQKDLQISSKMQMAWGNIPSICFFMLGGAHRKLYFCQIFKEIITCHAWIRSHKQIWIIFIVYN